MPSGLWVSDRPLQSKMIANSTTSSATTFSHSHLPTAHRSRALCTMSILQSASVALRQLGAFRYAASQPLCLRAYATVDAGSKDTHDDFKPKINASGPSDVASLIQQDISSNQVFLYMKGVPEAPNCGFSDLACKILRAYEVKFGSRNVLTDAAVRDGIKKFSNWPTIPQIFVKGDFVGGADILMSMHESGELEKLLGPIRDQQQAAAKK